MQHRGHRTQILVLLLTSLAAMTLTPAFAAFGTLPNGAVTPGATNPLVNQENIRTTICRNGYTATIRPPVAYTNSLKKRQITTPPYSAYGSSDPTLFEEDHLIPLELGGNPTSTLNLWPEPWSGAHGAHTKDQLENKLHTLVCAGSLRLSDAQSAIATNWEAAYQQYVLGIPRSNSSNLPTPAASPTSTTSPSATPSATISISAPASQTPVSQTSPSSPPPQPTPSTPPTQLVPPPPPTPVPSTPPSTSSRPVGATGLCKDGTYSFAASHRGMCSSHGGVAQFYA